MTSHIIMQGDAWELAKRMPSKSVQCIVTSPPYWGLRSYGGEQHVLWPDCDLACEHEWTDLPPRPGGAGNHPDRPSGFQQKSAAGQSGALAQMTKSQSGQGSWCAKCGGWKGPFGLEPTPDMFVEHLVALFRELRRVLRDDGTLWLNLGDSYNGSGGSTTTTNFGKQYDGKTGSFTAQPRHYSGLKPKDLVGIPWRVAFALQADGWWLRSDIIWAKGVSFCPTYSGSSMPESVSDRPSKSHEYLFLLTKSARYFFDNEAVKERTATPIHKPGNNFNAAKTSGPNDRGGKSQWDDTKERAWGNESGRNLRSVWTINPKPYKGAHFATYPPALITPCILAGTSEVGNCPECGNPWKRVVGMGEIVSTGGSNNPDRDKMELSDSGPLNRLRSTGKNASQYANKFVHREHVTVGWQPTCECGKSPTPAVVLDPFAGSGTTLTVALQHGRHAVGFELNPEYIELAEKRIAEAVEEVTVKEAPPLEVQLNDLPLFQERN